MHQDPCVYILQSEKNGRYYIGCSADVPVRLKAHNAGQVKATRFLTPWKLMYTEPQRDMTTARQREHALKRLKSHKVLEALIKSVG